MNEVVFDIKKFSYVTGDEIDVSFIPMMLRRKLNKFGRAGLYTLYGAYEGGSPNLVFSSCYGDFERVVKLITQRKEEGEVSPAGFSSSVHNATVGLFHCLRGLKQVTTQYLPAVSLFLQDFWKIFYPANPFFAMLRVSAE